MAQLDGHAEEAATGIATRIALLGILTIVAYGSWYYGFGVLLADIKRDLRSRDRTMALGFSLANVLTGALGAFAGRSLDRHGVHRIFLAGGVAGGGLLALSSWMQTPWSFAVVFGVAGGLIGATGFYAITQAIAARTAPGQEAKAITRLTIWGAFASPILIPATELSRRWWGWRTTLRLDAILVLAAFVAAIASDRDHTSVAARPSTHPLRAVRAALHDPTIRRLVGSAAATAAAVEILLLYQIRIMTAVGVAATVASGLAGARGLAQLLGRLPLTRTVTRFGVRATLVAARFGLAIGCLVIVLSDNLTLAIVYVIVAGATIGALSPLEGIFAIGELPPDDLGTLMGSLALLSGAAGAAGPILAAVVVDATTRTSNAAILAAVFAALAALVLPTHPGQGEARQQPTG
jgi:MFS family permease